MAARSFAREWAEKVARVRASRFWEEVSAPPLAPIERRKSRCGRHEVEVDSSWGLVAEGELESEGMARLGLEDLRRFLRARLGLRLSRRVSAQGPAIVFRLVAGKEVSRWDTSFELRAEPGRILVSARSERSLLKASLYLSNYWGLRRAPRLALGRRRVRPAVRVQVGADLWGGFSTTQAWIHGREKDANFLELARMGVDGVPIMILLEDYLDPDPEGPFASLANSRARQNIRRLSRLARQAARQGVHIFLMGYNPKLDPEHPVFAAHPPCRGALQSGGAFRTLCSSDPATRRFLAASWAALFARIPELGGLLTITGGEGFYHCFMRGAPDALDCRCARRSGSQVVSELVNEVARAIRAARPQARLHTWPYSAGHWSGDRDQVDFIAALDPEHVVFQTEIDKDSVDWRPAGYAKNIWDYSMSRITSSERCRRQRRLCRQQHLPFSVKIECNNSIECLNVPYLPALENQRCIWENARRLRPECIHSRWLFDGSCKSPSEELGFWAIWGQGTEYADLDKVLTALAQRDFGPAAAPFVRRAWRFFSEALRHHPQLAYYVGPYFVGPGQPLVLDPERIAPGRDLDPAFFGQFYWQWENAATGDHSAFALSKPLFYARPGFRAMVRRGPRRGQDVALEELQELARLWERGAGELDKARDKVPPACRERFRREFALAHFLALTWRSGAQVEEFLRLRDTLREFGQQSWVRSGHLRENLRDLERLQEIARSEVELARRGLKLAKEVDFLDLGLRLDMGTASTEEILQAKIAQVEELLAVHLPRWREALQRF